LDYLDEPEDSERRKIGRGIYTSYSFGTGVKSFRIILLDTRFNKSSWFHDWENSDILGQEQWDWLEETLINNNETFTFISSGTQILPFDRILTEAWYSNSRKKLFNLIGKIKKGGVILLSGDIHSSQILKTFCTLPRNILQL